METDIQKQVLEKIRTGAVAKRPRLYFWLQVVAIAVLSVVTLLLSIFVLSFIVFSVHESGEQFLLGFGQKGVLTLVTLFPWFTLLIVLALLVVLEILVRNFRHGYRIPILRIFLFIAAAAMVGSVIVSFTPLHSFLLDQADHDALPVIGPAYEGIHDAHEPQGVYRGDVASVATSTFVITHNDNDHDTDDGSWTVVPPAGFDMSEVQPGERVYVAGEMSGGVVHAYGVQPF